MICRSAIRLDASIMTKETDQMTVPACPHFSGQAKGLTRKGRAFMGCLLAVAALLVISVPAQAATPAPAWKLTIASNATNFKPGETPGGSGSPEYTVMATNIGGAPTTGTITLTDVLPTGLTPSSGCPISGQTFTCEEEEAVSPGRSLVYYLNVEVDALPDPTTLFNSVTISGGGATTVQTSTTTTVSNTTPPFGLLDSAAGLSASLTGPDGLPVSQAGSHPYQFTLDLGFPSVKTGPFSMGAADGGLRDLSTTLPTGVTVNPLATPIRCTESELEGGDICPSASQVGTINVTTYGAGFLPYRSPLYNMVPPPGTAAEFGFDAVGAGIYVHFTGGVHAGKYALGADSRDILARGGNPVMGLQVQLWGDPSSVLHESTRTGSPVSPQTTPFLAMPTSCSDELGLTQDVDSWGHPGEVHTRRVPLTDSNGISSGVSGCSALQFEPSLQARPTTTVADAPTGLSVDLKVPQTNNLNTLATANLRKADVLLPEGLVINPSSANGLVGCSSAQVGIDPATAEPNANRPSCPDASRIGTLEVDTPLVDHKLPGSIYVATPHDNPFDSLLAIYAVIDDPASGTLIKLPGHVIPDPNTGRLRTVFDENPQLPFNEFKLDFFGGATAPLRTPPTCGSYSTTSEMTPWSAPDSGPPAQTTDAYSISQGPGGACASNVNALPNEPSFDSGTISPIAGRYSPFLLNLRRNDGSQTFSAINVTPPPGLLGKLAGTSYCPEAALAAAASKSGNAEKANPSCPPASKIGTVTVGAGAGPAPYDAQGTAYLAGPYKGAPLSMAIITPAAAGPYDLGTVVVRTALNVDPATARISATSDQIPQILQGIPLDVRSVQVALDKPSFTINPTSCDPFSVDGQLTTALGQSASLESRFQVAECGRLAFKPKLSIKLKGGTKRGGHPALTAVLRMPEGGANIGKASVALPHSEFLDQAHIGTVCTRVQYAASQCPAASIYGRATAISPLLDQPLSGPVYLRSSNNKLPDLVLSLDGQIHVEVAGRIDSIKGGIRTTFESVPDAPVSKFVLQMQGAKKGLLVNSTNICRSANKATALFDGQNAKTADSEPPLVASCKGKGGKGHRRHSAR